MKSVHLSICLPQQVEDHLMIICFLLAQSSSEGDAVRLLDCISFLSCALSSNVAFLLSTSTTFMFGSCPFVCFLSTSNDCSRSAARHALPY
jgi:hypothetical protein